MPKLDQATSRQDMHLIPPDQLVIVTDKADPLYDERVNLPLDENLVKNIMVYGVKEPVLIRRDGKSLKVVAGRQRTRAAIEANKRLVKEGAEPMSVRCVLEKADDATMLGIMISENEARANDDALTRAEKLQRFMAMGKSKEEAAIAFCKPMTQIAALLKVGDCSPKVRAALKAEKISLSVAAKLSELEREAQDEQLAEAITSGETSFKKVYKKVQKKTGGKHSDAPSKKEVKAIVEAFKGILSKDAHDALRWVLDGSEHGCMKALLTEIRKGLDDKAA